MKPLYEGSCLCGKVRFAIDVEPTDVSHCHCSMCRKAHGAAFATYCTVSTNNYHLTVGDAELKTYWSSTTVARSFCGHCGSPMSWRDDEQFPATVAFPLAALDGDFPAPVQRHIFVASKAPWYDIKDDWPQAVADTE